MITYIITAHQNGSIGHLQIIPNFVMVPTNTMQIRSHVMWLINLTNSSNLNENQTIFIKEIPE